MINLSFLKLKRNITDNYELTKVNWRNKDVNWQDVVKVVSDSTVQYSPFKWRNGYKTPKNWNNEKQDFVCLDLDDGMTIPEAQKRFKRYTHILATTKSHQKLKKGKVLDRFRVLIKAINISNEADVYFKALSMFCEENDEQTLTKTASFLGYDDAIVIYNEGKPLDMFQWNELAKEELKRERLEKVVIDTDLLPSYGSMCINDIKDRLTYEIVVDVLESCGYELSRGSFRLREEERTASARVKHKSLNILDYGDKEAGGDIFSILMNYQGMSFKEALRYVSNFI